MSLLEFIATCLALVFPLLGWRRWRDDKQAAKEAQATRDAATALRATEQHTRLLGGHKDGVYGIYPPAVRYTPIEPPVVHDT